MPKTDEEKVLHTNAVDSARLLLQAVVSEDTATYMKALDQLSRYWSRLGHVRADRTQREIEESDRKAGREIK